MKLNAIVLRGLVGELQPVVGDRVRKISQLAGDDFFLTFYGYQGEHRVLLSLQPDAVRLVRVDGDPEALRKPQAEVPKSFCMLVRKHAEGARVTSVRQWGMERRVLWTLQRTGEEPVILLCDLAPTSLNLILLDASRRVLGDLNHRHHRDSQLEWEEGPDGTLMEGPRLVEHLADPGRLWRVLVRLAFGLNGAAAKEVAAMASVDAESPAEALDQTALQRVASAWDAYRKRLHAGPYSPTWYPAEELAAPWPYASLEERESRPYATFSDLVLATGDVPWTQHALTRRRQELQDRLTRQLAKTRRKMEVHRTSLGDLHQADRLRLYGELILASVAMIPKRAERISLSNYYEDPPRPVEVALDPALSASANAQKYFHRYKKAQRGQAAVEEQLARAQRKETWLEEMVLAVASVELLPELEDLERQVSAELRKAPGRPPRHSTSAPRPRRYQMGEWDILVGRNPRDNEEITLRLARPDDLWFHARQVPGCHVLVRHRNPLPVPDEVLVAAATLAAQNCKARTSDKVAVDYALARHVRKPAGTPPGYVTYKHERTLMVSLSSPVVGLQPKPQ